MNRDKVYQLLTTTLGIDVYQDFVPETATLPAVSYFRLSSTTQKPIKGSPDLRQDQYQINIVTGTSRLDTDDLAGKIRALDGKYDHTYFQYINVIADSDNPRPDPTINVFGVTIDVEFTPRALS